MTSIRLLTLSLLTTAALGVMSADDHARAACELAAGGAGNTPMSGATVNCVDNLDTDGVVAATATGVTVNVQGPAGGISTTGAAGVLLGDGATISVAEQGNRPISTSGDLAAGIDVQNGAMITVNGQVTTSGGTSPGIRTGDMATIEIGQKGLVSTGGGMSPSISVGANSMVTIKGGGGDVGGRVTTGNSNSDAVLLRGASSMLTVENGALVTTSSGMSSPVKVEGADGTVDISGDVRSSSGNSSAIVGTAAATGLTVNVRDGGFVTAQSSNSNAIEAMGDNSTINVEMGGEVVISSGNSIAVKVGANSNVNVTGTIKASSSQSQGVVLGNASTLTMMSGGVIETSSSESQAVKIDMAATTAEVNVLRGGKIDAIGAQAIVDEGMTDTMVTVDGIVFGGSSEPVLDMGAGDDTVIVNGTVRGSSADPVIDLGAGNDTFTDNSSQTVEGPGVLVDGGAGMDTFNLNNGKMNDSSNYSGFEETNVGRNMNANDPANGMESSLRVNSDQTGNTINANEGGRVDVSDASMAGTGTVNANSGGTVNITADNTANTGTGQSGTTVNVRSGGTADVASGGMTAETQTFTNGTFDGGSLVSVNNSDFITGTGAGNQITLGVDAGRFAMVGGAGSANASAFGTALDASFGANPAALDAAIAAGTVDLRTRGAGAQALLSQLSGEIAVQSAVGGLAAAGSFAGLLRTNVSVAPVAAGTFGLALDSEATYGADLVPIEAAPIVEALGQSGVWFSAFGTSFDVDSNRSSDFDGDGAGFAFGAQRDLGAGAFDNTVIGIAGGYSSTDVSGAGASADIDAYHLGAYAAGKAGALQLSAALSYAYLDLDGAAGGGDGDVFTAQGEMAYDLGTFGTSGITVAPLARLSYTYADFSNGGPIGPLGVTTAGGDLSQTTGAVGVRFGHTFDGGSLSLEATYERVFGDDALTFTNTLAGATPFASSATVADENRLRLGFDTRFDINASTDITLRYDGVFGDDVDSHTGSARLSFRF